MGLKKIYQEYSFTIPANGQRRFDTHANFLMLLSSSLVTQQVPVSLNNQNETEITVGIAIDLRQEKIEQNLTQIIFKNPTGSAISVRFSISHNQAQDNRLVVGSGTINVTETSNQITSGTIVSATAATAIIPANPDRKELILYNTGTTDVFVGDSSVTFDVQGAILKAGKSIVLTTTAEVYVRDNGTNETIAYLELERI